MALVLKNPPTQFSRRERRHRDGVTRYTCCYSTSNRITQSQHSLAPRVERARSGDHPKSKRPRHLDDDALLQPAILVNTTKVVPESPPWSYPCPRENLLHFIGNGDLSVLAQPKNSFLKKSLVFLSLLLFLFTIPHTLEDFALGGPTGNGVPVSLLAGVIAG